MNIFKRTEWMAIAKDRTAIMLIAALVVAVVAIIALTVVKVQPKDIQVPVRYSGYGSTGIYRGQWYVPIEFAVFSIMAVITNGLLAIKLYQLRRTLGLGLLAMTLFIAVLAIVVATSVFNLAIRL